MTDGELVSDFSCGEFAGSISLVHPHPRATIRFELCRYDEGGVRLWSHVHNMPVDRRTVALLADSIREQILTGLESLLKKIDAGRLC